METVIKTLRQKVSLLETSIEFQEKWLAEMQDDLKTVEQQIKTAKDEIAEYKRAIELLGGY